MLWRRIALQALLQFIEKCLLIGQSVVLGFITDYFAISHPSHQDTVEVYLFACALVVMGITMGMVYAHGSIVAQKTGMMARVICTAAIYERILHNSSSMLNQITTGHVINIVSNDAQRLDHAFLFLHYLWIGPLYVIVYTYLVYQEVGSAVFLVTGFVLTQIPLQMVLGKLFASLRLKSALVTDSRVKAMKELISGIRVIKMYTWEMVFMKIVNQLRRKESLTILKSSMIRAGNFTLFTVSLTLMTFMVFSTYSGTGGTLTPKAIFTILSLSGALRVTSIHFFVLGILNLSESSISVRRIEEVLNITVQDAAVVYSNNSTSSSSLIPLIEDHAPGSITKNIPADFVKTVPKSTSIDILEPISFRCTPENVPEDIILHNPMTEQVVLECAPQHNPNHILEEPTFKCATECCPQAQSVIRCDHMTSSWDSSGNPKVLVDVCFQINNDVHLLGVVGPVGAGKSTLLHCLLGELKPLDGFVDVRGKVSYASQEPWIFSGSLRENILFGSPFEKDWYNTVIEACGLRKDISSFANGDLTILEDQGTSLSGGQRSRVNLARAVYYKADIYLLDDPFSAVDAAMARHIFDKCVCGLLKQKTVVLVINQLHFFDKLDWILALNSGKVFSLTTPEELHNKGIEYHLLLGTKEGLLLDEEDEEEEEEEKKEEEVHEGGEESTKFDKEPVSALPINPFASNCLHKYKMKTGPRRPSVFSTLSIYSNNSGISRRQSNFPDAETSSSNGDTSRRRAVGMKIFLKYILAGASPPVLLLLAILFLLGEGSNVAADVWLSNWQSNDSSTGNDSLTYQKIAVYGGITGAVIVFNVARIILVFCVAINASKVLHNRALRAVLRAPILFFDTSTLGSILNLFSKDVGILDDIFPFMLCEFLMLLLRCLAILLLTGSSVPWIFLPIVPFVVLILFLRTYYLRSANSMKNIEAEARSPLYSHISMTIQGLPTIRTFAQQPMVLDAFHNHQDSHSQPWYICLATTRWFGMRIDALSTALLAAVAFISISLSSSSNGGIVGLGLTYTTTLAGMLQYCVRLSGEVESVMVSAERLVQCSSTEPEDDLDASLYEKPHPDWPQKGDIVMEEVSFRYSDSMAYVLKSISLAIKPGEKIGIVGRTGAGKSSLIHTLFRMAEMVGNITIDGVDTRTIGLCELRKRISIIPQVPFLFNSTVRNNLDPFHEFDDIKIWNTLEKVQLRSVVEHMQGGLEGQIAEGGSNFSVGQRQLMCLARALLRENKILILDEATANIDFKTDSIVQKVIRDYCTECTVLVIAHHLRTVMDSDRILVLNRGRVREFGEPYALLQNSNSLLQRIIRQTGSDASKTLTKMAFEHHNYKHQETLKEENDEDGTSTDSNACVLLAEHIFHYT